MRRFLSVLDYFIVTILVISIIAYFYVDYRKNSLPDNFTLLEGTTAAVFEQNNIDTQHLSRGENSVDVKLLGILPLKSVSIDVVENQMLIPCGTPVGIYIETEGILVIDVVNIRDSDGNEVCPASPIIQKGDYILEVNGEVMNTKAELIKAINDSDGNDIIIKIKRNGEISKVKLKPVFTENKDYKLGIWVRDNTQGVGMLTYVTLDGNFAALGHGIHDTDTNELMELSEGALYEASILGIVKGEKNSPGELIGSIYYDKSTRLGEIFENTEKGIYGEYLADNLYEAVPMQIAYKQDIKQGAAQIYTSVDGECRAYDIEVLSINLNSKEDEKGFMFNVVDQELINLTGGVVQGMSGSPIIQDGKIVGAVTHVCVNL